MKRILQKIIGLLAAALMMLSLSLPVFADGTVTYEGTAKEFIFAPGSEYSPTDLFTDFKGLMPGDRVSQLVTVKNEASKEVKVRIYMRSTGAQPGSEEFLSQLHLTVAKAEDNDMAYMFDDAADQTGGLTDWVLLGTLYSGGQVDLEVTVEVPATLDNQFQDAIGYLDWQFRVEELPVEPEDPKPPQTGDTFSLPFFIALMAASGFCLIFLMMLKRRKAKEN